MHRAEVLFPVTNLNQTKAAAFDYTLGAVKPSPIQQEQPDNGPRRSCSKQSFEVPGATRSPAWEKMKMK